MTILKRDLIYTSRGNGIGVSNRDKEKDGDYERVAHINANREVTYYEDLHPEDMADIKDYALTANPTVSFTQPQTVFKEFAGEKSPVPLDMSEDLVISIDYTYDDDVSGTIIEANAEEDLQGAYPMEDGGVEVPVQMTVVAKDQYGSFIELDPDMDQVSLNVTVIKSSNEGSAIQLMNGLLSTLERIQGARKDNPIDAGGLLSEPLNRINAVIEACGDTKNNYFIKDASELLAQIKAVSSRDIKCDGKSLAETPAFGKLEKMCSKELTCSASSPAMN